MLSLLNGSTSRAVNIAEEASKLLASAGYQRLSETSEWKLQVGGRYYFTRNLSTLVAFAVGTDFKAGNGFHLVGAHTDRYVLRSTK